MIEMFVKRREDRWRALSALLDRAGAIGIRRRPLSVDELDELVRLYRQTSADLAIARRDFPQDRITLLLNQLVTRSYALIYREAPTPFSDVKRFYGRDLPREYRASGPYLAAAAIL